MKRVLAAMLAAAAVVTAAGCGGSSAVVPSRPYVAPVADRGPLLAGQVQVVAYSASNVRICPPYAVALAAVYRSGPPQPPFCASGLRAVGVDTQALQTRAKAVRWGLLYLVGRYTDGRFYVTSQRDRAPNIRAHDPFAKPPCRTPRGGWLLVRSSAEMYAVNHYRRLTGHRDITALAFFDNGSILTLASTHPGRTRAVVGRYGPRQLCVVRSRYSRKAVHMVRQRVLHLLRFGPSGGGAQWGWPTGGGGVGVSPAGQPTTDLNVLIVTPKLRAFLDRRPRGIVAVDAALHPVPRQMRATAASPSPSLDPITYAERVAGDTRYFAGVVDDPANATVHLNLVHAPQSIIRRLRAEYPDTYVIDNDAPRTWGFVLQLRHQLLRKALAARGIDMVENWPTQDGRLVVSVESNVGKAQAYFDRKYGRGVVRVRHAEPASLISND